MSNLPFLLLMLLFIAIAPAAELMPTAFTPLEGLLWGALAYGLTLAFITFQNAFVRRYSQANRQANIALLIFMFLFCFVFKSLKAMELPVTLNTLILLSLYFFGLALCYFFNPPLNSKMRSELYFLIPFTLPLLGLNLLTDASAFLAFDFNTVDYWTSDGLSLLALLLLFFVMLMVLMPYAIQACWQCEPLQGPVRHRLESICARANFRYRDLKTWGVMDHALTAAILGIYWRFRYVLFTKRLLAEMTPECIDAILIHEIGHNKHKHLAIYPFLIAGMMLLITALTLFFEQILPATLDMPSMHLSDFEKQLFAGFWLLACYIVFPLLYLRYVFGFFSRLFERQADLHIFALEPSPSAMIESLNHIGILTGTLRKPNWHHYSLQERIDFLNRAEEDRNLIAIHHHFVQTVLYIYSGCFLALLCFLFYQL